MKKFVMGIVVGAVLSFGVSSYADEISQLIGKQVDNEYPVVLNGQKLENVAPSIEGTSYAPVREISEKLGLDVEFKDDTVILSKPQQSEVKNVDGNAPIQENAPDIEAIERQIFSTKLYLSAAEESYKSASPEAKPTIEKYVNEYKAKLADLEKQKAELLK
jgi:Phr family secreted Rap phosphatase inhibitor